jgi:hypothetical protein
MRDDGACFSGTTQKRVTFRGPTNFEDEDDDEYEDDLGFAFATLQWHRELRGGNKLVGQQRPNPAERFGNTVSASLFCYITAVKSDCFFDLIHTVCGTSQMMSDLRVEHR